MEFKFLFPEEFSWSTATSIHVHVVWKASVLCTSKASYLQGIQVETQNIDSVPFHDLLIPALDIPLQGPP